MLSDVGPVSVGNRSVPSSLLSKGFPIRGFRSLVNTGFNMVVGFLFIRHDEVPFRGVLVRGLTRRIAELENHSYRWV